MPDDLLGGLFALFRTTMRLRGETMSHLPRTARNASRLQLENRGCGGTSGNPAWPNVSRRMRSAVQIHDHMLWAKACVGLGGRQFFSTHVRRHVIRGRWLSN